MSTNMQRLLAGIGVLILITLIAILVAITRIPESIDPIRQPTLYAEASSTAGSQTLSAIIRDDLIRIATQTAEAATPGS